MEIKRLALVVTGLVMLASMAVCVLVFNGKAGAFTATPAIPTTSFITATPTAAAGATAAPATSTAPDAASTDTTSAAGPADTPTAGSSIGGSGSSLGNGPPAQPVRQVTGKITALGGDGFTLTAQNSHVYTVTVAADAWVVVNSNKQRVVGTLADLKVGEAVMVVGLPGSADGIEARVVMPGASAASTTTKAGKSKTPRASPSGTPEPIATRTPQPGVTGTPQSTLPGQAPATPAAKKANKRNSSPFGPSSGTATIQSIENRVLTLKSDSTSQTTIVKTDARTLVIKGGLVGLDALKPGDKVEVRPQLMAAARPSDQTPAPGATPSPAPRFQPNKAVSGAAGLIYVISSDHRLLSGQVKSVNGANFTLLTFGGDYTYTTNAQTAYGVLGAAAEPKSPTDLGLGNRLYVYSAKVAAGQPALALVVLAQP